jgi:hypothetical protein
MADPPQYTSEPVSVSPATLLVNIAPLPSAISFQTGFLGHSLSKVSGEVQVKFTDPNSRPPVERVDLVFRGVERDANGEIELTEQRRSLWDATNPSTSDAALSNVPSNMPFEFELTSDLPHCIHLPDSSLEYTLTATVYGPESAAPIVKVVPVHLIRYSASNSIQPPTCVASGSGLLDPLNISKEHPTPFTVSLPRSVFRRSEVIPIRVHIPPPTADLAEEKGVKLRNVSAELRRRVKGKAVARNETDGSSPPALPEPGASSDLKIQAAPPPPTQSVVADVPAQVLSYSGKSARFSSTRTVFIRLFLRPPSTASCEAISQSTILHDVEFTIRVTVCLSGREGDRVDVVVEPRVYIVPDQPVRDIRSEKQREVVEEPEAEWDESVPSYYEASTSGGAGGPERQLSWDEGQEEEEYDGYEEASAWVTAVGCEAPPAIDEDESPPTVEQAYASSVEGDVRSRAESFTSSASSLAIIDAQRLHVAMANDEDGSSYPQYSTASQHHHHHHNFPLPPSFPAAATNAMHAYTTTDSGGVLATATAAAEHDGPPPSYVTNVAGIAMPSGPPPYSEGSASNNGNTDVWSNQPETNSSNSSSATGAPASFGVLGWVRRGGRGMFSR